MGVFTQAGQRQNFDAWASNFDMTPNGECPENGSVRFWPCVKILTLRHLCENPEVDPNLLCQNHGNCLCMGFGLSCLFALGENKQEAVRVKVNSYRMFAFCVLGQNS